MKASVMIVSLRCHPFFTVGHSNRSVAQLVALLVPNDVGLLVDVRKIPRSRTNPQFNADTLPSTLAAAAIDYDHMPALGGLRGRARGIDPETNAFWDNE